MLGYGEYANGSSPEENWTLSKVRKAACAAFRLYGEMAEWSKAAVLKTVGGKPPGGSNPSLSACHKTPTTVRSVGSFRSVFFAS